MSTTSRRLVAVAVAAIIAVLTGITVGLLAARQPCAEDTLTPTATPPAAGTTTGTSGVGAKSTPAPSTPTSATCERGFAKGPAAAALAGTLVGGVAVLGLLFAAAPPRAGRTVPAARPGPAD